MAEIWKGKRGGEFIFDPNGSPAHIATAIAIFGEPVVKQLLKNKKKTVSEMTVVNIDTENRTITLRVDEFQQEGEG